LNGGERDGDGATAQGRLILDRLGGLEHAIEQSFGESADKLVVPRKFYSLLDLPDNLVISEDLGIKAGGYLKKMFDGGMAVLNISQFAEQGRRPGRLGAKQVDELRRIFGESIYFRPVASRKNKKFVQVMGRRDGQYIFILFGPNGKLTPDGSICFLVIDPRYIKSGYVGWLIHHYCQLVE
jgi:hypothetical protein